MSQAHQFVVGQVSVVRTLSAAELCRLLGTGHPGGTVSTAAASAPDAMRRIEVLDLPEITIGSAT
ncbi:MAG: hypothetical protein ACKO01_04580 [Erythrobacter sp.]